MRRLILIFGMISGSLFAQENLVTLNDCYENMMENYPLVSQTSMYEESSKLNMKNYQAGWLPNAELNAKATYQSDAMEVSISAMGSSFGFKSEKDQYQATIDLNQLIYDWGRIKASKNLENSDLLIKQQNTRIELNKLKEQINLFYFAILTLHKNEKLVNVMLEDVENQEKMVESAVKNGLMLSSDLNTLKAEKLKIEQSITEIINRRLAAIRILSEITGLDLSSDIILEIPEYEMSGDEELLRPEHQLFDLQIQQTEASGKLIAKQNNPVLYSFAQVGYGKPGLNMVSDEFDTFYIVGVGLSWNIWDWNQTKRKKQVTLINKNLITTQKESYDKQIMVSIHNELANIATMQSTIISDKEIIELREEVTNSARSKLENGVITSTEYITELSAETQAKINYETHKLQLLQSKVNYLYLKGEI